MFIRIKDFYQEVFKKHHGDTVLVVSHGGTIMLLQGLLLQKSLPETANMNISRNTEVTEFLIDAKGKAELVCLNCGKHLK